MPRPPSQRDLFAHHDPRSSSSPGLSPAGEARTRALPVPPGRAIVRALLRHGWMLVPVLALALGAAWLYCRFAPPVFRATAQLEAEPEHPPVAGLPTPNLDVGAIQSLALELGTPQRIAAALGSSDPAAVHRAARRLVIEPVPHSRTLTLRYDAEGPATATAFLRTLLATAWRDIADRQREAEAARVRYLTERADQARLAAEDTGRAEWDLARRHGFADPAAQLQLATTRWQKLASEETAADVAGLDQAATLAAHAAPVAPTSSDATAVIGTPLELEVQRAQAAADVARLAAQYRPQAAPLVEARQRLSSLEASLASLQNQAREARQRSLTAARAKADDLAAAIARQARRQGDLERFLAQWNLAHRALQADQNNYSSLLDQLRQATAASGAVVLPAHISQPPQADPEPVSPSLPAALGAALALGVLASVGVLALAERTYDRIGVAEATELGVPLLTALPRDPLAPEFFLDVAAATATLLASRREGASTVLLVSAVASGEGKTTVALALARQLAAVSPAGVLLLDAHRQRPALQRRLDGAIAPGLAEVLRGDTPVDSAMRRTYVGDPASHLFYIAAGRSSDSDATSQAVIIAAGAAAALIAAARARFDWIVVDAGGALDAPDPVLWAPLADAALLVARAHRTPRHQLRSALDRLEAAGSPSAAIVLNRLRRREHRRFLHTAILARPSEAPVRMSLQQRAS